jgi:hypothetical protein
VSEYPSTCSWQLSIHAVRQIRIPRNVTTRREDPDMIFDLLKRLGGSVPKEAEAPVESPVEYEGYTITPTPMKDASGWRVAARIAREIDGELRTHEMIRADVFGERAFVVEISLRKARQCIDERGERLFEIPG